MALKIEGDGPLRKMVLEADATGRVLGYVAEPNVPWPLPIGPWDVAEALGRNGLLTVVKDLRLKNLYQGMISLETGEMEKEIARYLNRSEQVASLVELGMHMDEDGQLLAAGGLLIQLLPGEEPAVLRDLARRLAELPPPAARLAAGQTPRISSPRCLPASPMKCCRCNRSSFSARAATSAPGKPSKCWARTRSWR